MKKEGEHIKKISEENCLHKSIEIKNGLNSGNFNFLKFKFFK